MKILRYIVLIKEKCSKNSCKSQDSRECIMRLKMCAFSIVEVNYVCIYWERIKLIIYNLWYVF